MQRTRTLGPALLAPAWLAATAAGVAGDGRPATAQPTDGAAADVGGLLEPTPLILKDGRIAHVSIHLVPFATGQAELGGGVLDRLDQLSRVVATDCFLTAQVIGHVEPEELSGGNTLDAHRLARSRADMVQNLLIDAGLPPKAIASVWDWQFLVREPRVTLWLFRLNEGEDCEGTPLRPGAERPAQVASRTSQPPPPAATSQQAGGGETAAATATAEEADSAAAGSGGAAASAPQTTAPPPATTASTANQTPSTEAAPVETAAAEAEDQGPTESLPVETAATAAEEPPQDEESAAPAASPAAPEEAIETAEAAPRTGETQPTADESSARPGQGTTTRPTSIASDDALLAVVTPGSDATSATTRAAEPQAEERDVSAAATTAASPAATTVAAATADRPAAPTSSAQRGEPSATVTFPVNSSYFSEEGQRELAALANNMAAGQRYRVELIATVGTGDVAGATRDEALRYNRWLAGRRLDRVQDWLQENAGDQVEINREFRDGPERQVEVRLVPAG